MMRKAFWTAVAVAVTAGGVRADDPVVVTGSGGCTNCGGGTVTSYPVAGGEFRGGGFGAGKTGILARLKNKFGGPSHCAPATAGCASCAPPAPACTACGTPVFHTTLLDKLKSKFGKSGPTTSYGTIALMPTAATPVLTAPTAGPTLGPPVYGNAMGVPVNGAPVAQHPAYTGTIMGRVPCGVPGGFVSPPPTGAGMSGTPMTPPAAGSGDGTLPAEMPKPKEPMKTPPAVEEPKKPAGVESKPMPETPKTPAPAVEEKKPDGSGGLPLPSVPSLPTLPGAAAPVPSGVTPVAGPRLNGTTSPY